MMKKIKVYIASPYTLGDQAQNVRKQIVTGYELMQMGYSPYIPELNHFIDLVCPLTYDECIEYCLQWVGVCDCVLRLPGESKGADMEVEYALSIDLKVFYSIEELNDWYTI
jgi:hypothetical protein